MNGERRTRNFEKQQIALIRLFLVVVTLTAFWQLKQCNFINYDDPTYVTGNIHIRQGITMDAIRWAFTSGYAANWHPLTWMSHMLDVQLFGLNAHRHHLINLLFHIANTLLLFSVLHRMTKAPLKSAFVAALFALHPLHVESVAWVSERKDVLSTFFWMLTMAAYVSYVESLPASSPQSSVHGLQSSKLSFPPLGLRNLSSVLRYVGALVFFASGLMSKPMLVSLPIVLLLLDYWPLGRTTLCPSDACPDFQKRENKLADSNRKASSSKKRKIKSRNKCTIPGNAPSSVMSPTPSVSTLTVLGNLFLEKIPFFVLAAFSCIVTYAVQQKGGAVKSIQVFPLSVRISNALVSSVLYMKKTIWPADLAIYYPHPGLLPFWKVIGAVLFLGALVSFAVREAIKFPYIAFGLLWFAVTLTPVIGIIQVGDQAMADRYTYVPVIGLFVLAAWLIPELLNKRCPAPLLRGVLLVSSTLILACLCIATWTQVGYWANSISLYDHTLEVTNRNFLIHYDRGAAYVDRGNYGEAIEDFNSAIEIDSKYAPAYGGRGIAYEGIGNYPKAIGDFNEAVEIDPSLAWAYNHRGALYGKLGDFRQAIEDFNRVIEIDPGYLEAYYNRGAANSKIGNCREAISDFSKTIEADPGRAEAYYNLAVSYGKLGDYGKEIENYGKVIEINPGSAQSYNSRGIAHDKLGNYRQAISNYDRALEIDTHSAMVFNNRGNAYGKLGNYRRAIEDYDRAVELDPGYVMSYYNRGVAYFELGQDGAAKEDLKNAARRGCEEAMAILRDRGINW